MTFLTYAKNNLLLKVKFFPCFTLFLPSLDRLCRAYYFSKLMAIVCQSCHQLNPDSAAFCGECGVAFLAEFSCPTCRRTNPTGLRFCRGCGARLWVSPSSVPPAPPSTLAPLTTLANGRYLIQRFLGEGAKKRVYLAQDTQLDRNVALAVFKAEGLSPEGLSRIQRETRALALLGDHPHIVTLYDVGDDQGNPYFVSQYMAGGTLQELLLRTDQGRLPVEETLRIGDHLCQALTHAHRHGVMHRDLKPSNIWLTQDGIVKLGDFGLATSLDHSRLTLEGVLIGTAAYVPPEQLQGRSAEARSDLYALGAILYEMVTGRPPFIGDTLVSLIAQHLNTPPVRPSSYNPAISPALDTLILQLLAKTPEERPESAAVVRAALQTSASTSAGSPTAAPHALDRLARDVFVGREREMDELRASLEDTLTGQGRAVVLLGEAGIGKTRLAMELATYVRLRGVRVLFGRCHDDDGAPPYWPWRQMLRSYVAERERAILQAELGPGASDIAQVLPEVQERLPHLPPSPRLEPEHARFRFFDSVTRFLKRAAKAQPLLLFLDDLQWADTSSLLLLRFVAQELGESRFLLLVTCREEETEKQSALAQTLGVLTRTPRSATFHLQGLTEQQVSRFMELTTGQPPTAAIAEAVFGETEGHPFFLTEIVRLLETERSDSVLQSQLFVPPRLPQSIRTVIERRLARLSEECRHLLAIAAVSGREFSLSVLQPLEGSSLLLLLDEAIAARLVAPVASLAGRYSFSHALVRETLYETLPLSQRLQLHHQIGAVLEDVYGNSSEAPLAELAHHFLMAAQGGGNVAKAVDYAKRAGDRALTLLAYEEAIVQYEHALQALALQPSQGLIHGELLLALGEAQRRAGNIPTAQKTFLAAAAIARQQKTDNRQQTANLLARVALSYGATLFTPTNRDSHLIELCEEALALLGEEERILRARILAQLAMWSYYNNPEQGRTSSEQAVRIALQVDDARTLAIAFGARRYAIAFPENLEERLTVTTEMVALGRQRGYREVEILGHQWRTVDVLEQGDQSAVEHEIAAHAQLAEELQQPLHRWYNVVFQAMSALRQGQLLEGERLIHEAFNSGLRVQSQTPSIFFGIQMYQLRMFQGRFQDLEEEVKRLIQQHPRLIVWQCALAYLYCELNRQEEAYRIFAPLAADDFAGLPRDLNWNIAAALSSEICCFLDDTRAAAVLYQQLLPYAERHIIVGPAIASFGSASYYLGRLATTLERWQKAETHFIDALAANARMAAWPWVAYNKNAYAIMLRTRNQPGDQEKAAELVEQALSSARELRLVGLIEKIQSSKWQVQSSINNSADDPRREESTSFGLRDAQRLAQTSPVQDSILSSSPFVIATSHPHSPPLSLFRREGDYWTITYQGVVLRLKDTTGLRYVVHLLRHPHHEFHVMNLVQIETNVELIERVSDRDLARQRSGARGLGDAGEALDTQARTAHRQRIAELREELTEARNFNDRGRIEKLEAEIEFFTQELAGAVGLGGRNRKAASATERARVNVTRAIKAVIKKVAEQNEELGLYFASTLKTGAFCSYTPDPRFPVTWQF